MADVGRLRWIMTADTRGFERGVGRIRHGLMSIGRVGAGLLGGAGLVGGVRAGLATADAIGKIARATGVTTDELQQLRFAMQEAGGTASDMDRALERFSRRVGELATTHRGQLAEFLRRTNQELFITLKRSNSTTEALLALSRAMAALPRQRQRQALGAAAFGRATPGVVNVLGQGPEALRRSMGRIPADQLIGERLIKEAEKTNDEILLLTEKATLAVSKAALETIAFVQELRRTIGAPGRAIAEAGAAASGFIGENFPWTLRLLRYRGVVGRLLD